MNQTPWNFLFFFCVSRPCRILLLPSNRVSDASRPGIYHHLKTIPKREESQRDARVLHREAEEWCVPVTSRRTSQGATWARAAGGCPAKSSAAIFLSTWQMEHIYIELSL